MHLIQAKRQRNAVSWVKRGKGLSQVLIHLRNLEVVLSRASTIRQGPKVQLLKPSNKPTKAKPGHYKNLRAIAYCELSQSVSSVIQHVFSILANAEGKFTAFDVSQNHISTCVGQWT